MRWCNKVLYLSPTDGLPLKEVTEADIVFIGYPNEVPIIVKNRHGLASDKLELARDKLPRRPTH